MAGWLEGRSWAAWRALGHVEGQTLRIEWRLQDDQAGVPLTSTGEQLAALDLRAIVAANTPAILAAAGATSAIPIVACLPHRPLFELGLVDSRARPLRNVTGAESDDALFAKSVELLARVVPWMRRLGILYNPETTGIGALVEVVRAGADQLGLEAIEVQARQLDDLEGAFASLAAARVEGLFVATDSALTTGGRGSPVDPLFVLPSCSRARRSINFRSSGP
jgi:putative ABC transport system substrate-binding protein